MRKSLFALLFCLLVLPSGSVRAHEVGFMMGGLIDIKDSTDFFVIAPYYSTSGPELQDKKLNFFIPLSIGFATDLPDPVDGTLIGATPSVEYDIKMHERAYLSPQIGLEFTYIHLSTPGVFVFSGGNSLDSFELAIPMGLQLKFPITKQMIFRFSPVGFRMAPWRYISNGIGSDSTFTLAYSINGGLSYLF